MESNREERYRIVKTFINSRIYKVLEENNYFDKVIFTQGEPTLNPELINYIKYAKKLGYKKISVISNGRRYFNTEFVLDLIENGVTEFIISIHGHNSKIHDKLTTSQGSFQQTITGISNLSRLRLRLPIKIIISHVVNKENYKYLRNFLKLLKVFFIDVVVLNIAQPLGKNMEKNFSELMPRYKDIAEKVESLIIKEPELFISNMNFKKRYVSVIDLPLCLSEKVNSFVGFGETRVLENNKKMSEIINVPHKTKKTACKSCKYFSICEGVYKNYIKKFGWREFKPVAR